MNLKFLKIFFVGIAKFLFDFLVVVVKSTLYSVIQIARLVVSALKLIREKGILHALKITAILLIKIVKRIAEEIATFGNNLIRIRKTFPLLLQKPNKNVLEVKDKIDKISKEITPIDGRVPKGQKVNLTKFLSFALNLFKIVHERFLRIDAEKFSLNLKSWFSSTSKRYNLIIVEATNQDVDDLADMILNGVSTDRFLLTGLTADISKGLLNKLKIKWSEKLSDTRIQSLKAEIKQLKKENIYKYTTPSLRRWRNYKKIKEKSKELSIVENNQADFINFFKNTQLFEKIDIPFDEGKNTNLNFNEILDYCSIEQLIGPHMCQAEIGVKYEKIKELDDHFHVNLEQVFCYAIDNNLNRDVVILAKKIGENGISCAQLRSENFESCPKDEDGNPMHGPWMAAVKDKKFIKKITQGITSIDFFKKLEENPTEYEDTEISENYNELFDVKKLKKEMYSGNGVYKGIDKTRIDLIDEEVIDFFKELFTTESLFNYVTPNGISRATSSSGSQIASKKAEDVSSSLTQNTFQRPTASAIEVEFSNGTISLDIGGDMVRENMDKNNSYKLIFYSILAAIAKNYPDMDIQDALKMAYSQTVSAYVDIEKKNLIIKELERGRTGADKWREFGTDAMNKIIKYNDKAIVIFDKGGYIFAAQTALQVAGAIHPAAGATAFGAMGANAVPWALNTTSLTGIAYGIESQTEAITTQTTNTNTAFSVAGEKKYDAQRERSLQAHKVISVFEKEIARQKNDNEHDIAPNLDEFNRKQISNPNTKVTDDFSNQQELIEAEMVAEIKEITESEENDTGLVDLPKDGLYTLDVQEQHVIKMLEIQARRSKKSAEIQYNKDIVSWINSASSRERLVIIESEVYSIENLANIVFNASPLDRVLVTGLDCKIKRDQLKAALKELWRQKLDYQETEIRTTNKINKLESSTSSETSEMSTSCRLEMSNKKAFIDHFKTNDNQTFDEILDSLDLKQLLGPHLHKRDNDISFKSMNSDFEYFDVNIQEILLYGKSNELVNNLANLSQKSKNKSPGFPVKSEKIKEGDGPWRCEARNPKEFNNLVAKGLSAKELIGLKKQTINGKVIKTYENIIISPVFDKLFDIKFIEKISAHLTEHGNHDEGHKITQEDLDYFKTIMFDECLYSADTSPEAMPKTISKATSILLVLASKTIADYLYPNMIGYAYNSILEVIYSHVSSTMDAGTDLLKESSDKKNQYKGLFDQLLDLANHHNTSEDVEKPIMDEKICLSFVETLECYHNNENINKDMRNILEEAHKYREASLFYINKSEAAAHVASTILQVQLPLQAASYGVGIAASVVSAGILAPFLIAGASIGAASLITKFVPMKILARANAKYIPYVNQASGLANATMHEGKQKRAELIAKALLEMQDSLINQKTNPKLIQDIRHYLNSLNCSLNLLLSLSECNSSRIVKKPKKVFNYPSMIHEPPKMILAQ